jgi:hexosaminidase
MRVTTLRLRACVVAAVVAGTVAASASAQAPDSIAIIPRPASLRVGHGWFVLSPHTVIWTDRADSAVARRLSRALSPATGYDLPVRVGESGAGSRIVFRRTSSRDTTLGTEGYRLDVAPSVVTITAAAAAGAFYATQTIRQLLPAQIFRSARVDGVAWRMPAVAVVDRPRFQWRGMHLDVSRHFMPKEFVKKYIDLLALQKMSRFPWHLTDDQGWRIEIRKYPRLTSVGGWRSRTLIGHERQDTTGNVYDNERHGGYYTQDDVREIVAYARDRFVTIVPEIEMPGHSQAAIAAYPNLGNFGDSIGVWDQWGVSTHILNPSDTTIRFMQDVLTEVMSLFPGSYVHIGGDEATKIEWKASPRAQARIKALGLADENQLQSWFTTQMDTFLAAHGRRLVGWDEILEGGLAPNAIVMSWRGTAGGIAAARAGHDVVMAPGDQTYFNYYQSPDTAAEPLAIGGYLPIDSVYAYDPMPAELEPRFASHILGAQGQIWTEYIGGPKAVEYMAYPRACALAEVLWTPKDRRDFGDFTRRLAVHESRLDALDVNYHRSVASAQRTTSSSRPDSLDEPWPTGTFSILGYDPRTGEIGGAVQSRVFSVGNGVLWAEAGVGAAATQAIVDVSYGPQALELLRQGKTASDVVKTVWERDPDPRPQDWSKEGRQFAVIDAKGNVFAYTGPKATPWAGHKSCSAADAHCTAQGNILASSAVVDSMVAFFERTPGHLAYRLLAALEGGQLAGGDARGMESAAMLIVKKDGGVWLHNDTVLRLQVDDNPEPIKELRRLVERAAAVRQIPRAP